MFRLAFLVVATFLIALGTAEAQLTIGDYQRAKDTQTFKAYIAGVGAGYTFANATLEVKGQPQLYCAPERLVQDQALFLTVLEREVKESLQSAPATTPIAIVLLTALEKTFPCTRARP